jgi:hypothetical protein
LRVVVIGLFFGCDGCGAGHLAAGECCDPRRDGIGEYASSLIVGCACTGGAGLPTDRQSSA